MSATDGPWTKAESTKYRETSLHADVLAFLGALRERRDPRLVVTSFGASPEGRDLPLVVLSKDGVRTPEEARETGRPVVLVINGIHAGEVEGKEASQMILRDTLAGVHEGLVDDLVLVVVPLFNPDGNDRVDPRNRALDLAKLEGHIGPEKGVGTRVNASGVNLNRDYLEQRSLEMRLLQSRVCRPWRPHLTIDCHATNGSVHRFDLTYDVPHTIDSGRREPIEFMRDVALPEITRRMKAATGRPCFFYGNFVEDESGRIGAEAREGWMTYPHHPRFGSNFRGLTNRMDLLLETYSYLPYPERVATTHDFLLQTLRYVAERGRDVVQIVEAATMPPERVAVRYRLDPFERPVQILTRSPRTLEGEPIEVTLPHFARFVGTEVVERPWAYALDPAAAKLLELHGLALDVLESDRTVEVEVARIEAARRESSRKILEASSTGEREIEAHYERATRKLPAGTRIVRTGQPLGAVATYLCEARSDDGLVACGALPEPKPGDEFPVARIREPLR
jgi:hypothetical protein